MPVIEGGRPLLRGRLFGFPVHLDLSFVIIMGVLGYYPGVTLRNMLIWLLITPGAVLAHELGHAVLARTTGAHPQIALAGFGGVTSYVPPGPLSRPRSLAISLAGPGVGLVLGAVLFAVQAGVAFESGSWQAEAVEVGIFTCFGWSLLNLLPVLPLDGGQALRELIPGNPVVRTLRAAYVSVAVAVLAGVVAYYVGYTFLAIFMAFFAISNVMTIRAAGSSGSSGAAAPRQAASPEQAVIDQLWLGHPAQARDVLAARSEEAQVDAAIHGAVMALNGQRNQGHAVLQQELTRRPDDVAPVALLGLTLALEHDWDALVALVQGPRGAQLPKPVVERAADEARGVGREDVAGRLTYLARNPPP